METLISVVLILSQVGVDNGVIHSRCVPTVSLLPPFQGLMGGIVVAVSIFTRGLTTAQDFAEVRCVGARLLMS